MTIIHPTASYASTAPTSTTPVIRTEQERAPSQPTSAPAADRATLSERALLLSRLFRAAQQSTDFSAAGTDLTPAAIDRLLSATPTYVGAPTGPNELSVGEYQLQAYAHATDLENQQLEEAQQIMRQGIAKPSAELKLAFQAALADLPPELREKDWGFSVKNGAVVIKEGSDALSAHERKTLEETFAAHAIGYFADQLATLVVKAIELERGWGSDGESRNFGQYDVTRSNFSDIVDLREYLQSHEPGGKYEWRTLLRVNQNDYSSMYAFTGQLALMAQISLNADPRFAGDNIPHYAPFDPAPE